MNKRSYLRIREKEFVSDPFHLFWPITDLNVFLSEIIGTKCQCDRHYMKGS